METPARRLIKPTTPRTVHLLNLRGVLPAPVQSEATTESAFVLLAALCPAVRSIASQPATFELPGRSYTPDYRVETADGPPSYWEVKLETRIDGNRKLFGLAATHLAELGSQFFVISERTLRRARQDQEARLVLRYAKANHPAADVERVAAYLRARSDGASIAQTTSDLGVPKELVFHAIAKRVVTFHRDVRTAASTRLVHPDFVETKNVLHLASWFGVSPWRANA